MYNKYKNDEKMIDMVNADIPTFRPTFVINEEYDEPYCEDEFLEMRIANIMFRQAGPCIRCKTTTLNWKMNMRHPKNEPYATICQVRKHHKLGPLFGVYFQPEIITNEHEFEQLLPDYDLPSDRPLGLLGIVHETDKFKIRVRKRTYYLS